MSKRFFKIVFEFDYNNRNLYYFMQRFKALEINIRYKILNCSYINYKAVRIYLPD